METRKKMMHVGLYQGDVGEYIFLPSSPERAEQIAAKLEDAREMAYNREYRTFTGMLEGTRVSVCSTGMGGPSACIAIEELQECGGRTMLRVGTCEAIDGELKKNELVLPNGAVRMEGVSAHYSPVEYPAVPDMDMLEALEKAAIKLKKPHHIGIAVTSADFHTQFRARTRPNGAWVSQRWEAYKMGGALCADVTTAPLLICASSLGIRAGAVLGCSCEKDAYSDDAADWSAECESSAIEVAVEAMREIIRRDRKKG